MIKLSEHSAFKLIDCNQSINHSINQSPAYNSIAVGELETDLGLRSAISIFGVKVDDGFIANSVNPVQSKVIKTALDSKADKASGATSGDLAALDANDNLIDSGYTIATRVPSDAVFTDTKVTYSSNHYTPSTASGEDKSASGATAAWSIDVIKGVTLKTDGKGHVPDISVTSGKIPANPANDGTLTIKCNSTSLGTFTANRAPLPTSTYRQRPRPHTVSSPSPKSNWMN
jgi:hypothetical protein